VSYSSIGVPKDNVSFFAQYWQGGRKNSKKFVRLCDRLARRIL